MEGIDYVSRIESARVYDVARVTALDRARRLSDRLGANVYLKREDTQDVHSFKIRGAYQKMSGLSAAEEAKRLVAEKGLMFIPPYDDPDVAGRELDAECAACQPDEAFADGGRQRIRFRGAVTGDRPGPGRDAQSSDDHGGRTPQIHVLGGFGR